MSQQSLPMVAVVILTCNQKDTTLRCLESLSRCDYPKMYIVLVDNGSTDGTTEAVKARYSQIHLLYNETNLGAAGGRNLGIDYVVEKGDVDYFLFMDNDIVVTPFFLMKLVVGLENVREQGVEIATPKLYLMGTEKTIDCAGGAMVNFCLASTRTRGHGEHDVGQYDDEKYPKCVPTTATILFHRNALLRGGRFDVAFDPYGYEDLDMVLRSNIPETPFLFVADSIVYHKGSKTGFSGYSIEYAQVKAANFKRFLKRHATLRQRVIFGCLLPFLALKPLMREFRKGNVRSVFGLIKGFFKS